MRSERQQNAVQRTGSQSTRLIAAGNTRENEGGKRKNEDIWSVPVHKHTQNRTEQNRAQLRERKRREGRLGDVQAEARQAQGCDSSKMRAILLLNRHSREMLLFYTESGSSNGPMEDRRLPRVSTQKHSHASQYTHPRLYYIVSMWATESGKSRFCQVAVANETNERLVQLGSRRINQHKWQHIAASKWTINLISTHGHSKTQKEDSRLEAICKCYPSSFSSMR